MITGRSRTITRKEQARRRGITPQDPSIVGIVAIAKRGPIGVHTRITSWDEYLRIYGGHTLEATATRFAQEFLNGGGAGLSVVRTAHYTDILDAASFIAVKGTGNLVGPGAAAPARVDGGPAPFNLVDADTIITSQDGGGDETSTFNAAAASVATGDETFVLVDLQTLTVKVDQGPVQTVVFATADFSNIALATALEVAAVLSRDLVGCQALKTALTVALRSDTKGTGSYIEVTGGTANGVLGFSTSEVQGTGNVADITAVTQLEAKTVIEAATTNLLVLDDGGGNIRLETTLTGLAKTLQVQVASTADGKMGFDNALHTGSDSAAGPAITVDGKDEGAFTNVLAAVVEDASNGDATLFNFLLKEGSVVKERFRNVSPDPTSAVYVVTVVNNDVTGSPRVRLTDLNLPSNPRPTNQSVNLAGGDDGLTGLVDSDFLGASSSKTGLHALNTVKDFSIVCLPDRGSAAAHNGVIDYVQGANINEMIFAVLDPAEGLTRVGIVDHVKTTALLLEDTEAAAIFWPRVKVVNPDPSVYGTADTVEQAPSGMICATFARQDARNNGGGIYEGAAGVGPGELRGAVDISDNDVLDPDERDILYDNRINPILVFPGTPVYIDGTHTLKSTGDFPSIPESRGVIKIARSVDAGLERFRHRANNTALRAEAERTVDTFLRSQVPLGAFRSDDPTEAYIVTVSDDPNIILQNTLRVTIAVATAPPINYVDIILSQKLD